MLHPSYDPPISVSAVPPPTPCPDPPTAGAANGDERCGLRAEGGAAPSDRPRQHAFQAHGGLCAEEGRRAIFRPEHPGGQPNRTAEGKLRVEEEKKIIGASTLV